MKEHLPNIDQNSLLSFIRMVIKDVGNKEEYINEYLRQCYEIKDEVTIREKYLYHMCYLKGKKYTLKQLTSQTNLKPEQKEEIRNIENHQKSPLKDTKVGNQKDRFEIDTKLYLLMQKGEQYKKYVTSLYENPEEIKDILAILQSNYNEFHDKFKKKLEDILKPSNLPKKEPKLTRKLFHDAKQTKKTADTATIEAQKKICALESSLLKKEQEIEDLKQKLERNAETTTTAHKKKADELEENIKSLEAELEDRNQRIKKLNTTKRSPRKQSRLNNFNIKVIDEKLQSRTKEAKDLKATIAKLKEELRNEKEANKQALANSNEQRTELEQQLDEAKEQAKSLKAEIELKTSELANFITESKQQLDGANSLAESLKERLEQKESELVSLKEEKTKLNQQLAKADEQVQNLAEDLKPQESEEQLRNAKAENKEAQENVNGKKTKLEQQLAEVDKQVQNLTEDLKPQESEEQLRNAKAENKEDLENSNKEQTKLEQQLAKADEQVQNLAEDLKPQESEEQLRNAKAENKQAQEANKLEITLSSELPKKPRKYPVLFYSTLAISILSFVGSFGLIGYLKSNFVRFFKNFVFDLGHRIFLALILTSVFFGISAFFFSNTRSIKTDKNELMPIMAEQGLNVATPSPRH